MSTEATPLVVKNGDGSGHISTTSAAHASQKMVTNILGGIQVVLLILFVSCTKIKSSTTFTSSEYIIFRDIMVMLLLGFGYLMTFLSKYGLGAVGLTMMVSVISIELNIIVELFCRLLYGVLSGKEAEEDTAIPLPIGLATLIDGEFAAATILISFGAVIGRATPLQLMIMALCQSVPYAFNKVCIVFGFFSAEDVGGSMTIHMFGAFFGLAVSYVLGPPKESSVSNATPSTMSDVLAFIGTTLLWVYWPSFVGATESATPLYEQNCFIHTIMALMGSTLASFYMSQKLCHGKFDPVHIANSTLAGGVAVGSSARLMMTPGGALLLGMCVGVVSVYGYVYSTPYLERTYKIYDTCGVGNLHGWPSVVGGLTSAIFVLFDSNAEFLSHGMLVQFLCQIFGVAFTIVIAIASGYGTGTLMVKYGSPSMDSKPNEYDDSIWWESPYFE